MKLRLLGALGAMVALAGCIAIDDYDRFRVLDGGGAGTDSGPIRCESDSQCGPPIISGWSACESPDACGSMGMHSREVRTLRCVASICVAETTTEVEDCTRNPEGAPCGAEIPEAWGGCNFPTFCAEDGMQSRIVHVAVCRAGTCADEPRTDTMPCTRDTDGMTCDDGDSCSPSTTCTGGVCSGFICAPCPC